MKTAYELAMERLAKAAPLKKLTDDQKRQLAELDAIYAARVAEREIALKGELAAAQSQGDAEAAVRWQEQLARERASLQQELEAKKQAVRDAS
jgi:hypothetical protein